MVQVTEEHLTQEDLENGLMDWLSDDDEAKEELAFERYADKEPAIVLNTLFASTVIVAGIPILAQDRYERFCDVFCKILNKEFTKNRCVIQKNFKLEIPQDENNNTVGVAFITFSSHMEAKKALRYINKLKLDISHTLKAVMLDDFDRVVSDENQCKPPLNTFGFIRDDLRSWWFEGERMRDQFVVRYADQCEINWFDPLESEPTLVYNGARERAEGKRVWTDQKVEWSRNGSYLVFYRRPGIALYGGPNFELKIRFEHMNVQQALFSPGEEYLLTWDGTTGENKHERSICIWHVITGELLGSFPTPSLSPTDKEFPHFLWNHDGKYIARLNQGANGNEILVYQLPEMLLLSDSNGNPMPLKYAAEKFDWSPTDNVLSVVIPGSLDTPARLMLIDIPSRRELSARNVYNVISTAMHWHPKGDCLCLRTTVCKKTGKKGRKQVHQLEIFRLRERNVPVDTIKIEDATVKQLYWEDGGSKRFALVVKNEETGACSIRFYRVSEEGAARDTVWVTTFETQSHLNHMQWSPTGNYFVLACLGSEGTLLFCHLSDNDKVEVLFKDEHFMMNSMKWSPCGRFLASCVNVPMPTYNSQASSDTFRYSAEAGFCIWTFQGRRLYVSRKDNFYSFEFRPTPLSLIENQDVENIKKNMKEYTRRYDQLDEKAREEYHAQYIAKREAAKEAFLVQASALLEWISKQPRYEEFKKGWEEFYDDENWEAADDIYEVIEVREELLY